MARFKKARRYYSAAKRYHHSAGGIGGKFGGMIPPLLGGGLDGLIGTPWGIDGIGSAIVGWGMKSSTTRDIGLNRIGRSLAQKFMGGGLFGSNLAGASNTGGDLY